MTNIYAMPRVFGVYGPVLSELFDDVFAPIFADDSQQEGEVGDRLPYRKLTGINGETAYKFPKLDLGIGAATLGNVPLHLQRGQLAAMLKIDVLTLDLSRPGGVVDVEIELAGPNLSVRHSLVHLVMWIGAEGEVAFVDEAPSMGIDYWKPSVLLTRTGLALADTEPFADEADRVLGILRAVDAANRAHRKVALAKASAIGGAI